MISDVVKAQMRLFDRFGIKQAHAVIGGSLGGMQALCFAIEFPNSLKRYNVGYYLCYKSVGYCF